MFKKLLTIFLLILLYFTSSSLIKISIMNDKVNDFIKDAELVKVENARKYYEVPRKEYIRDSHSYEIGQENLGQTGDILVNTSSPFQMSAAKELIELYFGGHAAIVTDEGENVIEAQGNRTPDQNVVRKIGNNWDILSATTMGLGIKGATEEEYSKIDDMINDELGKKYNYLFPISISDSYYCTDIISRTWNNLGYNLNNDHFIVTIYDLIASNDTYINYYHYEDSSGIKHIYYVK